MFHAKGVSAKWNYLRSRNFAEMFLFYSFSKANSPYIYISYGNFFKFLQSAFATIHFENSISVAGMECASVRFTDPLKMQKKLWELDTIWTSKAWEWHKGDSRRVYFRAPHLFMCSEKIRASAGAGEWLC